jgi:hypothetical protein
MYLHEFITGDANYNNALRTPFLVDFHSKDFQNEKSQINFRITDEMSKEKIFYSKNLEDSISIDKIPNKYSVEKN